MTSKELADRLQVLCFQLGYVASGTFVTLSDAMDGRSLPHSIRDALTRIGVEGVFGLDDGSPTGRIKPVVYVAAAENEAEVLRLRREVWTQGVVPFLLIVTTEKVLVCSGFEPPSKAPREAGLGMPLDEGLARLAAGPLRSSITWKNFDINAASMVDNELLAAVQQLSREAGKKSEALAERPDLVSALIGRFLYLYVLLDRGIITEPWLDNLASARPSLRSFVDSLLPGNSTSSLHAWGCEDAFAVFDALDQALNGSVFPIREADRHLLDDASCRLIHGVLRLGEQLQGGMRQLSFLHVSYRVIRTETISALYERFVAMHGVQQKKDKGVFYTPPYLVDHVLDRIEEASPFSRSSRVVDPAAGSGIFLVGALRRILERHTPEGGWRLAHLREARSLLTDCIYGIEELPEAANVCRFSLYLTLFDYVGQIPLEDLKTAFGDEKFLPSLEASIRSSDAFSHPFGIRRFTHVVGNPPWSQEGGQKDRRNQPRLKKPAGALAQFKQQLDPKAELVGHNRLADYFYWLGTRLAEPNGTLGFVMPARSLIGKHSSAFAHAVASRTTPVFIGNLAHLRRKLFEGAEAAACIVVARNRTPDNGERAVIYRPLLSSLPIGKNFPIWILPTSRSDIQTVTLSELRKGNAGWFEHAMLGILDRRTLRALSVWTSTRERSIAQFIERSGLVLEKGLGPRETGISRLKVGNATLQISRLTSTQLETIPARRRGRFAGNVILLPRAPRKQAIHLVEPHLFPTTFNALFPREQLEVHLEGQPRSGSAEAWTRAIASLMAYFNSGVVAYFVSLYAPTYLMDAMRFEREDLLTIPCPFLDLSDPALLSLEQAEDIDEAILDAMMAGEEFRSAFREFRSFRNDFGNAQLPMSAFDEPEGQEVAAYLVRLKAELGAASNLPGPARCETPENTKRDGRRVVTVMFADAQAAALPALPQSQFLGGSSFAISAGADAAVLVKSTARYAWTIEQAVADATVLRTEIAQLQETKAYRVEI